MSPVCTVLQPSFPSSSSPIRIRIFAFVVAVVVLSVVYRPLSLSNALKHVLFGLAVAVSHCCAGFSFWPWSFHRSFASPSIFSRRMLTFLRTYIIVWISFWFSCWVYFYLIVYAFWTLMLLSIAREDPLYECAIGDLCFRINSIWRVIKWRLLNRF